MKVKIRSIQIVDVKVFESDCASALIGEVDDGCAPVCRDRQILEAGNARDRGEIDGVFPIGEVRNRVVSVASGEYESIIVGASRYLIVTDAAIESVLAGTTN